MTKHYGSLSTQCKIGTIFILVSMVQILFQDAGKHVTISIKAYISCTENGCM